MDDMEQSFSELTVNDVVIEPQKRKKKKSPAPPPQPHILPELFSDEIIVAALHEEQHFYSHSLPLTCGLLMRLRAAFQRAYRRSECRFVRKPLDERTKQFYNILCAVLIDDTVVKEEPCWSSFDWVPENPTSVIKERVIATSPLPRAEAMKLLDLYQSPYDRLWSVAEELTLKSINLSLELQKKLSQLPLLPLHPLSAQLQLPPSFLDEVRACHDSVRRPVGTFSRDLISETKLQQLCALDRESCAKCNGRRQVYCGHCGGRRMPLAESSLPARVDLPFDVLLLLHHQESLNKCTGIHTGAMCAEGSVSCVHWAKERDVVERIIASLDPLRDVLLFPYPHSTNAEVFPWKDCRYVPPSTAEGEGQRPVSNVDCAEICNSDIPYNKSHRWRLVVLEASWNYAKSMSNQITTYRKDHGLPPLPSVILTDVVGQYWRFQAEGHSAVSTIEAIAHTAYAAGISDDKRKDLLCLFELQKFRVLTNDQLYGSKTPRAVEVEGAGLGSWKLVDAVGL
jgi:DTW domain-containing protein YfiP